MRERWTHAHTQHDGTEEAFAQELWALGWLSEMKPSLTDFTPYQHRQPIETTGKPLSEVIIEERRQVAVSVLDSSAVVK